MKAMVILAIIMGFFFNFDFLLACTCKSHDGKNVDWFIMYKVPSRKDDFKGTEFFYMDAGSRSWSYMDNTSIKNKHRNPLYLTLRPIYEKNVSSYAMYNDQPPKKSSGSGGNWKSVKSKKGHSKGVVAFGDGSGFWNVSSVPRFPAIVSKGYQFLEPQTKNGQTMFCITDTSKNIEKKIGNIFDVIDPYIYEEKNFDNYIPKSKKNSSIDHLVCNRITVFAKSRNCIKDIYEDIISRKLKAKLLVRTWRPNLTDTNMVTNVKKVCFKNINNTVEFTDGNDHSKWAVSETKGWICLGDLNRETRQKKRGGLSVCLHDDRVAKEFKDLHEKCQPVQPGKKGTCSNSPGKKKIQNKN